MSDSAEVQKNENTVNRKWTLKFDVPLEFCSYLQLQNWPALPFDERSEQKKWITKDPNLEFLSFKEYQCMFQNSPVLPLDEISEEKKWTSEGTNLESVSFKEYQSKSIKKDFSDGEEFIIPTHLSEPVLSLPRVPDGVSRIPFMRGLGKKYYNTRNVPQSYKVWTRQKEDIKQAGISTTSSGTSSTGRSAAALEERVTGVKEKEENSRGKRLQLNEEDLKNPNFKSGFKNWSKLVAHQEVGRPFFGKKFHPYYCPCKNKDNRISSIQENESLEKLIERTQSAIKKNGFFNYIRSANRLIKHLKSNQETSVKINKVTDISNVEESNNLNEGTESQCSASAKSPELLLKNGENPFSGVSGVEESNNLNENNKSQCSASVENPQGPLKNRKDPISDTSDVEESNNSNEGTKIHCSKSAESPELLLKNGENPFSDVSDVEESNNLNENNESQCSTSVENHKRLFKNRKDPISDTSDVEESNNSNEGTKNQCSKSAESPELLLKNGENPIVDVRDVEESNKSNEGTKSQCSKSAESPELLWKNEENPFSDVSDVEESNNLNENNERRCSTPVENYKRLFKNRKDSISDISDVEESNNSNEGTKNQCSKSTESPELLLKNGENPIVGVRDVEESNKSNEGTKSQCSKSAESPELLLKNEENPFSNVRDVEESNNLNENNASQCSTSVENHKRLFKNREDPNSAISDVKESNNLNKGTESQCSTLAKNDISNKIPSDDLNEKRTNDVNSVKNKRTKGVKYQSEGGKIRKSKRNEKIIVTERNSKERISQNRNSGSCDLLTDENEQAKKLAKDKSKELEQNNKSDVKIIIKKIDEKKYQALVAGINYVSQDPNVGCSGQKMLKTKSKTHIEKEEIVKKSKRVKLS